MFDGDRRKVSIGDQIPGDVRVQEQIAENRRMLFGWLRNPDPRVIEPLHHLLPRRRDRERLCEDARIGGQTKKSQRSLPWNPNSGRSIELRLNPDLRAAMLRYVFKLRVEEKIRVDQNQRYESPSTSAMTSAILSRFARRGRPFTGVMT